MNIPVRVSINRKSSDGKYANSPYRDGKEFDSSSGGRPQRSPPLICSTPAPTRAFTFSCIGYPHWRDTCPPVHNHPTSLEKRERQGAPSHCPSDSVPLAPRQEDCVPLHSLLLSIVGYRNMERQAKLRENFPLDVCIENFFRILVI